MANYASGIGITAILVGLASASLKRRFGNQIVINISWALFIAMLLHAPSWLWLYILEGGNSAFDWKYHLRGVPGLRMYSYSVEVGIAAGLGLYFLSGRSETLKRLVLFFGCCYFGVAAEVGFLHYSHRLHLLHLLYRVFSKMWWFIVTSILTGAGLSLLLSPTQMPDNASSTQPPSSP